MGIFTTSVDQDKLLTAFLSDQIMNFYDLREFKKRLYLEKRRAERTNYTFSLIIINGAELTGSNGMLHTQPKRAQIFQTFLRQLANGLRETDVISIDETRRIVILLPDTVREQAIQVMERLNTALRAVNELREPISKLLVAANILILTYPFETNGQAPEHTQTNPNSNSHSVDAFFLSLNSHHRRNLLEVNGNFASIASKPSHLVMGRIQHFEPGKASSVGDVLMPGLKRILDFTGAGIAIILTSPVMLVVALLIKFTSRGPIIFYQERVGYRGKVFKILKFRSMRQDASQQVHQDYVQQLLTEEQPEKGSQVAAYKQQIDQRITWIGKILRRTSIDELPQLINVLRGEMSLVGPRPHPLYEVALYKSWNFRRLLVKPGLTGFSKIKVRCTPENYKEAMRYDIRYVDQHSLFQDLKILARTIPALIFSDSAY
ncbi:sugar transferase [candidate division KSB1 bacterium]|nr:sugar transferase [candidate division KSB1 bacterium]